MLSNLCPLTAKERDTFLKVSYVAYVKSTVPNLQPLLAPVKEILSGKKGRGKSGTKFPVSPFFFP